MQIHKCMEVYYTHRSIPTRTVAEICGRSRPTVCFTRILSYTYVCAYVGFDIVSNNILFAHQWNRRSRHETSHHKRSKNFDSCRGIERPATYSWFIWNWICGTILLHSTVTGRSLTPVHWPKIKRRITERERFHRQKRTPSELCIKLRAVIADGWHASIWNTYCL